MQLRHHPLMSYMGFSNWTPVWTWIGGKDNLRPKGEIGILREVKVSALRPENAYPRPSNRIFLFIEYRDSSYIGSLFFDDYSFCIELGKMLAENCGRSIKEIGDLEIGHTL